MTTPDPSANIVRRLVGVYNADGTLIGELSYFIAARLGRAHCALCDITHGRIRERSDWKATRDRLPVAFDTYHLNDQPSALRCAYDEAPIVAAETDAGFVPLLGPAEIAKCHGSVEDLAEEVARAVASAGLIWPA